MEVKPWAAHRPDLSKPKKPHKGWGNARYNFRRVVRRTRYRNRNTLSGATHPFTKTYTGLHTRHSHTTRLIRKVYGRLECSHTWKLDTYSLPSVSRTNT